MKFSGAVLLSASRRVGIALLGTLLIIAGLLVFRALFSSPLAEAATNVYNPGFCLGGWENPGAAAGKPGASAPDGGGAAAYLAPDVFAQIFCGYFPVTERAKPPKAAVVTFAFSLSGEAAEPEIAPEEELSTEDADEDLVPEDEVDGGSDASEEPPADESKEEEAPEEESPVEEPAEESSSSDPAPEEPSGDESSGETSLLEFFIPTAHAEEVSSENLLVVSYSFDGVRWYAAGRVNRDNAKRFTMNVPATMWNDLKNLQIMIAPLPISGARPDIYLESLDLKVEADLTISELAADGAAAVGDALGEVLGLADTLETAALGLVAPAPIVAPAAPPAPPAKVKKLTFEVAGNPINVEGSGREVPRAVIEDDGLSLRITGACEDRYYVLLTYRSIEDFETKPRSFASNYADECSGGTFTKRLDHLPVDTPPGVYYLLIASQGDEGSWIAESALLPIKIGSRKVEPLNTPITGASAEGEEDPSETLPVEGEVISAGAPAE